jgi:lipoprotein-anchoring transpeptidase ErfK/SrfK
MNTLKTTKPTALRSLVLISLCLLMTMSLAGCEPATKSPTNGTANKTAESREPTIEASPIAKTDDQWQVISADNITLKVNADDARSVRILYRPAFAEDRHVELKKIASPSDKGTFSTQFKVPSDFAGDVWAEVQYANGTKKETKPISLTVETISSSELADASYKHNEESARSDKITGGTIEKATFQPGQPDIRITVNVPAFQLTLWQGGKEVKTYPIGIGRREFPLPDGLRRATQIVFNPEWVPPDSSWIEDHDVVPGERVEADDPRNPLGKIKIPLGNGILIHQASRPSDLGHLVSHGCVRLLLSDLFDLCEKIFAARSLPVTQQQIDHAKNSKDRLGVKLDAPVIVDISYDTQVVEGGVLHLYPDVYDHKTNTVEKVREELQSAGVDSAKLDDSLVTQMLERVKPTEEFVVSVADIKGANAIASGKNQSLTGQPIKTPPTTARKRTGKGR